MYYINIVSQIGAQNEIHEQAMYSCSQIPNEPSDKSEWSKMWKNGNRYLIEYRRIIELPYLRDTYSLLKHSRPRKIVATTFQVCEVQA